MNFLQMLMIVLLLWWGAEASHFSTNQVTNELVQCSEAYAQTHPEDLYTWWSVWSVLTTCRIITFSSLLIFGMFGIGLIPASSHKTTNSLLPVQASQGTHASLKPKQCTMASTEQSRFTSYNHITQARMLPFPYLYNKLDQVSWPNLSYRYWPIMVKHLYKTLQPKGTKKGPWFTEIFKVKI